MRAKQPNQTSYLATLVSLIFLLPSAADALFITGGPSYELPEGATCTVAGNPALANNASVTCSGIDLDAHTHVYFGIRNDGSRLGNATDRSGPSGNEIWRFVLNANMTIVYTSTTTINNALLGRNQSVDSGLTLSSEVGNLTPILTGGVPADNGSSDISALFRVDSAAFAVGVAVEAATEGIEGFGTTNPHIYDPIHTPNNTGGNISSVDLAFYFADCGGRDATCPETDVRLVDGDTASEGRVEVFVDGTWGTVCDDNWDLIEAEVVCRQLGFVGAESANGGALFGPGNADQPIFLDDLSCNGEEGSLLQCPSSGIGVTNCEHDEDAGVVCATTNVRLIGGSSRGEGRVEVNFEGQWGTVCDDFWGIEDANVVCRQLGFTGADAAPGEAAFGAGNGPILMDDVQCVGDEAEITACQFNGFGNHNCERDHTEDASAVCKAAVLPTETPAPDTPTPTFTPGGTTCFGDCNGDGRVAVSELITAVNGALSGNISACPAADRDGNGRITVPELITAVNNALSGCPN